MANPVFIDCPVGTWTEIASNVTYGVVNIVKDGTSYLQTYRMTGDDPPLLRSDGVRAFDPSDPDLKDRQLHISNPEPIDVYIWAESLSGRVRVDL